MKELDQMRNLKDIPHHRIWNLVFLPIIFNESKFMPWLSSPLILLWEKL